MLSKRLSAWFECAQQPLNSFSFFFVVFCFHLKKVPLYVRKFIDKIYWFLNSTNDLTVCGFRRHYHALRCCFHQSRHQIFCAHTSIHHLIVFILPLNANKFGNQFFFSFALCFPLIQYSGGPEKKILSIEDCLNNLEYST